MSNSSGHEGEGEVTNCVSNLIHAFTDGLDIFKRLREKRRRKRKSRGNRESVSGKKEASGAELRFSKSLRKGPLDIQKSYENHYSKAGGKFAQGDAIAHASLAETLLKLNTGLVSIIAAFLNHDSKSKHLHLDYKSLTNLSDASRAEAIDSLNQLYQRLSQSQLQVYRIGGCPRCGSMKHQNCSPGVGSASGNTQKGGGKKKNTGARSRSNTPTIARVPIKKSPSQTQWVVMRPRNTRKGSMSSASMKSSSTGSSSGYASPLGSPLPQYTPIDPFPPIQPQSPPPKKNGSNATRRRAGSVDGPRPTTWPHTRPDNTMPLQHPLPISPKIPNPKRSPPVKEKCTPSPGVGPSTKRRIDKVTPSTYTFASDSTKLGEIPQRSWTTPWDYEEAERLNRETLENGYPIPPQQEDKGRKKRGLFGFLRRGDS
ncbi:hypothetical protein K469DRAFT_603431 [Zopfia rhizophila CBS 207.26]|uniref:Uncharacterized protein n=1 Tax=Zopfia rhizophila CBS 207.26 TaxID=1314779 RepID=A0A6A6DE59_9PEZI|nr:hypothetical protein K469DRAFT_603431 [Zopfia rhizophila CBS 207.26]